MTHDTAAAGTRAGRRAVLLAAALVAALLAVALRAEGRRWWCACASWGPWSLEVWSRHNSQHLLDAYTFTHVLHGLAFAALLAPLGPRAGVATRGLLALGLEALWEAAENTDAVIRRYREATMSLDYFGDSVLNSLGDLGACAVGFALATRLPIRWSVGLFVGVELALLLAIRDNLTLNVLMLVAPVDAIRRWQTP